MTPQQQAEKLVSDFYSVNSKLITPKNMNDLANRYNLVMPISKQCALIAVDEILIAITFNTYDEEEHIKEDMFWNEVKQEIEKI